jgi:hypothetical protein
MEARVGSSDNVSASNCGISLNVRQAPVHAVLIYILWTHVTRYSERCAVACSAILWCLLLSAPVLLTSVFCEILPVWGFRGKIGVVNGTEYRMGGRKLGSNSGYLVG